MSSGICSCGEAVKMDVFERLVASVRSARFGVQSGELSALEGIEEIESTLRRVLNELPEHACPGRNPSCAQVPASLWSVASVTY